MIDIFEILKNGKDMPKQWQEGLIKSLINPHMARVIIGVATLDMFVGGGDVRNKISNVDMLDLISPDIYSLDNLSRIYEDEEFYNKVLIKDGKFFALFDLVAEKLFLKKYITSSEEEKRKVSTGLYEIMSKIKSFNELGPLVEDGIKIFLDKRATLLVTGKLVEAVDNSWNLNDPLYEEAKVTGTIIDGFNKYELINACYVMLSILDIDKEVIDSAGEELKGLKGKMILAKITIENNAPNAKEMLKYATTNIVMKVPRFYLPKEIEDMSFRLRKDEYHKKVEKPKEVGKSWVLSKDGKIENLRKKFKTKPNIFGF